MQLHRISQTIGFLVVIISISCQNSPANFDASVEGGSSLENSPDTIFSIHLEGEACPYAEYADYGFYIPDINEDIRGVLILQHGCGMERFGITRPYDLQYQAFAKKWNLAIVETAIHGDCQNWHDPKSGSADGLFNAISIASQKINSQTLSMAPFLIFGHSSGGYWALGMLRDYPERIIAVASYSAAWDPQWDYKEEASEVPVLLRHAGANDGDPSVLCEQTALHTFAKLRKMDGLACIAYNEGQNHNFSYMRYMAIPFFDSALKYRLPKKIGDPLMNVDKKKTWIGDPNTMEIVKRSEYSGDDEMMCCFVDQKTANNWKEFVTTGTLTDKTPPPAPTEVWLKKSDGTTEVCWNCEADIESGILKFNIYVDDTYIGSMPAVGSFQSFDTNGDNTIPIKVPNMKYTIATPAKGKISVETVNHFNLKSKRKYAQ